MKTRPDKPHDDKHEELRQQLWELAYGLLEPHEESALVARVKSDPAVARLYAEVKLQTDLVQTAARVEDSSLGISAQGSSVVSPVSVHKEKRPAAKASSRAIPAAKATGGSFGTNWLAVVGTTALLLLLGYGLWQPTTVIHSVAQGEYYYTRVTGLAAMTEGVTQKVGVEYKDIHNNGRATELAVRLVDQEGRETYRTKVKTADDGRAEVDLPGTVLKKGVRLEVQPTDHRAERQREAEFVSTELQIAEEKRKTVLLTERPYAEPGESNRFQLFGVGQYSKSITPPATDELVVEKQSGGVVVQPMWTVDQVNGVISGEFQLPQAYTADEGLAMRRRGLDAAREESKQQAVPQTRGADARIAAGAALGGRGGAYESGAKANEPPRQLAGVESQAGESFELQRALNGVAKAELAKSSQAKADNAERDLKPGERGAGAAFGGSRPGMMRSTGPAGAAALPPTPPSAPAPPAPAAGPKPENMAPAAPAETMNRKNAAFAPAPEGLRSTDKPQADATPAKPGNSPPQDPMPKELQSEKDRQLAQLEKSTVPAPNLAEPTGSELERLSGAAESKKFAEARKTVESLKELSVQVPEQARGEDLVLVARDGDGRVVARRELAAYKEAEASVNLPPEVHGLVDVELFRKDQPVAPVLRQQLVRASARSLQFEVSGLKEVYAPGEKVQLAVRVVDELGQPAAAAASVRVWNDAAARAAGSPLLLVDSLTRNDLADDVAEKTPAPAAALAANAPEFSEQDRAGAADRKAAPETPAIETAPVADPVASEVFFVDNRSAVQQDYERAIAIQEMQRSEQRQSFGRVLMWSGAGLMLLVGVLLLARRPLKSVVWIPAVGLAALSLALGVSWFLPQPPAGHQLAQALPDEMAQTSGTVPEGSDAVPGFKSTPMTQLPLPESPVPGDAPVIEVAPGAPSDPGALGAAIGGGQSGGAGSVDRVDRNLGADKQADFRKGEQLGPEKQQSEIKPRADVAPFAGQAAAKKSDGDAAKRDQFAERRLSDQLLPDSLFWRPLSPIDQNGTFTIEFTMPAAESDYRLLIDAIGSGRIGGKEQLLRCRAE